LREVEVLRGAKDTLEEEVSKNKEKKGGEEKWPTNSRASMMSPSWENNNCKVSQMIVGANWCVWGQRLT
jgi:hypothetical protein